MRLGFESLSGCVKSGSYLTSVPLFLRMIATSEDHLTDEMRDGVQVPGRV